MDTGVGFRGAMLNLKDCQYPSILGGGSSGLIYPTLGSLTTSGVPVCYIVLVGKICSFDYMSWVLLCGQCFSYCVIIIMCKMSGRIAFPSWCCCTDLCRWVVSGGWAFCVWIFASMWWQKPGRAGAAREILSNLFLELSQGGSGIRGTWWRSRCHETCPVAHDLRTLYWTVMLKWILTAMVVKSRF